MQCMETDILLTSTGFVLTLYWICRPHVCHFYRTQVSWFDLCVRFVSETPSVNLTDVTLADKETNLIQTDKVNRVIQGNVAMQVTQPGGQPSNFGSDVT